MDSVEEKLLTSVDEIKKLQVDSDKKVDELAKKLEEKDEEIKKLQVAIIQTSSEKRQFEAKHSDDEIKFFKYLTAPRSMGQGDLVKNLGLQSNIADSGGVLIPTVLVDQIVKKIFNEQGFEKVISEVGTIMRSDPNVDIPIQNSMPIASRRGEAQMSTASNVKFNKTSLRAKSLSAVFYATWESLNYQTAYGEGEILKNLAQSISVNLAYEIINGTGVDGVSGYSGILNDPRIERIPSTNVGSFVNDDLMWADLHQLLGYNRTYLMSRAVESQIRTQKGTTGYYLAFGDTLALSLKDINLIKLGQVTVPDYDNVTQVGNQSYIGSMVANLIPNNLFILGDLDLGYKQLIVDKMSVLRDPYTSASQNQVKYIVHSYNDGSVVLPDAIKIIELATSKKQVDEYLEKNGEFKQFFEAMRNGKYNEVKNGK